MLLLRTGRTLAITRSTRKLTLHLPKNWPWAEQFNNSLARLRTIVLVT